MKVLYVEDDPDAVANVQRIVRSLGYDLLVATTIAQGLALLEQYPDLILADSLLPDGDAISFITQVRQDDALTPIIAISGYVALGERERYLRAGCTEYFTKPVHVGVLIDLLKRHIR